MADYRSKVHNVYLSMSYLPMVQLRVFANVSFNKARTSLDEVVMPDVEDRLEGDLEDQDFTFDEMSTYSDLDLEYLNYHLGFEYSISPEVTWRTEGSYANMWDHAPYVYGDETGSIFVIASGFRIDF